MDGASPISSSRFSYSLWGVAIPYSFTNRIARGESRQRLFWHVLRRSVLLFIIGVFLNGYPRFDRSTLRIMNVLQRIAISYFLGSILYVWLRMKAKSMVWLCGTILVLYYVLMRFVPVPGYGAGALEPFRGRKQATAAAAMTSTEMLANVSGSLGTISISKLDMKRVCTVPCRSGTASAQAPLHERSCAFRGSRPRCHLDYCFFSDFAGRRSGSSGSYWNFFGFVPTGADRSLRDAIRWRTSSDGNCADVMRGTSRVASAVSILEAPIRWRLPGLFVGKRRHTKS